jgi:hypothetical protein
MNLCFCFTFFIKLFIGIHMEGLRKEPGKHWSGLPETRLRFDPSTSQIQVSRDTTTITRSVKVKGKVVPVLN